MIMGLTASAQVIEAGPDTSLCVNYYTMQGSPVPTGAHGTWYQVAGCGTIFSATVPTTQLFNLCVGSNTFSWVVDEGGVVYADEVVITVYDPNMPAADAGPDTISVTGPQNAVQLNATPVLPYPATCQWSILAGSATIAYPSESQTMISGLAGGENILVWTCENGPCWSAPTSDTLVIQMLQISTGMQSPTNRPTLIFDPVRQELRSTSNAVMKDVLVLDAQGRLVLHTGHDRYGVVPLDHLGTGLYVARVSVGGRSEVLRFVVER